MNGRGPRFGTPVTLAILGALALPFWAFVVAWGTDACSADSTAYLCNDGQHVVLPIAVVTGVGALVAGVLAGRLGERVAKAWPYAVLAVQAAGAFAIWLISKQVS